MLLFSLIGCTNAYEDRAIGTYELYKYTKTGETDFQTNKEAKLLLKSDMTFEITLEGKIVTGNWSADDYGDWTIVAFESEKKITNAKLGEDSIVFDQTAGLNFTAIESMVFFKISDK